MTALPPTYSAAEGAPYFVFAVHLRQYMSRYLIQHRDADAFELCEMLSTMLEGNAVIPFAQAREKIETGMAVVMSYKRNRPVAAGAAPAVTAV